ncbi:PAS domain S-box protein [Arcobacter roscoffensis]|uniref:PAS domain S-box protein n=1 Tax=Arcobacter roscoffensis TaxID=2961520 RepID=A0ABY5E5S4_9BACT|nr:HD domain-containing phosphohydrolase [Arcobacter roscoffensis]UTJ07095.1 PAS domain S-box protein [Arcobacter roscoffensis]
MSEIKKQLEYLKELVVLYVEDDEKIREEIIFFLERRVKKLIVACDGQEGLELYKENNVDLIITDIQMPRLDGIKMSEQIKSINKDARIIVITAFNDSDYLLDAINLNLKSYLTKPLDLMKLLNSMVDSANDLYLKNKNQELINTFEQYKSVVDEKTIVSKADINGKIIYANKPFEEISGFSRDEILGKSHNIIRHEDTSDELFADLWKTILNKKVWTGKIKNKKKNGDYYIVDTIIKPILDLDGNIQEFIALRNDITELERSKEYFQNENYKTTKSLKESISIAKTYQEAIDNSNMIIKIDKNRKIKSVNDAFCRVSKYEKSDLEGKDYTILKSPDISNREYENFINEMFDTLAEGKTWKGKVSNIGKDGKNFHCNTYVIPLKNNDGDIYEYMGIRHDITKIENLHKELEDTQRELIYRLGEVGETRSKETGNHVKRVALYSKLLAKKSGLSENDINRIYTASPMHDIGKIGIPDSILNKPDKLDDNEWDIMRTHSSLGYNILKSSSRPILQAAAIISLTHHEKWDGTGYPNGLKGDAIHIFGRITAIADVFDALGSKRVYKQAWPLKDILSLFDEQKGKHFDPELIELFMSNLDEFLEIKEKYED